MAHKFSLSLVAVDMLLEHGKLPRTLFPFQIPHIGTTYSQRAQVREAVFRDLESRDLMRAGRVDADVELALSTFASAPVVIAAAAKLEDEKKLFARVATDGQFAVVVKRDENMLLFEEARPTGVVPAIVDLLPLTPAAPGQSVTIAKPAEQPKRPARGGEDGYDPFASVAPPRAQSSTQMRYVERIFEKPRKRVGQFTAFAPARNGKQANLSPIAWFDTEEGRYFMSTRRSEDGQTWITYAPADNGRIAQQLYGQLEGYL